MATVKCRLASPQLVMSVSTKPTARNATVAREGASILLRSWYSSQPVRPIMIGNRNAGAPNSMISRPDRCAPSGPITLEIGPGSPVVANDGSLRS